MTHARGFAEAFHESRHLFIVAKVWHHALAETQGKAWRHSAHNQFIRMNTEYISSAAKESWTFQLGLLVCRK